MTVAIAIKSVNDGSPAKPVNTPWKKEWRWGLFLPLLIVHILLPFAMYYTVSAKWQTLLFNFVVNVLALQGITAGAHRLFSHKAYKSKWPLRAILVFLNTLAFQNSVMTWAQMHRVHHKYTETDADPHNVHRGFFFSHMGWIMVKHHPEYERRVVGIDMSDLEADPIVSFQHKFYIILAPLFGAFIPFIIPVYYWNESWAPAVGVALVRAAVTLHSVFLVNSAAHMWGNKPYDKNIQATESLAATTLTIGEGYHNYHHTFPWDYKAAELGHDFLNFSTTFIEFFAKIGWAYDLKFVSEEMLKKRIAITGDGSHPVWGWDDPDLSKNDKNAAIRINAKED